uniref:Uncharacterized protein n=1 Tax=Siphoviridae sp. ctu9a31 TaxID=2825712 RepID=A0A8S5QBH8_9CAUD|nr:MAG TPA: hypothetical protein [Siphoviridae sp. ctu9a31]
MRVISQDGTIDIPYDYFSLSIAGAKIVSGMVEDRNVFSIFCHNLSSPNGTKLAEYSTEAKAVKAMKMLKEHYGLLSFMKLIAGTTKYEIFINRFTKDDFIEATTEYFQFPQDDEIEV